MSSSLNSCIAEGPASGRRRVLMLALAALPALLWPLPAAASTEVLVGMKRWGQGSFRRFGFLVYEATLWAGDDPLQPPLALRLDYKRTIRGRAIAEASVEEMRRFVGNESQLSAWGEQMQRIFPDVTPGDHLTGVYRDGVARFYQGDRLLGIIDSPGFAEAFFAIWLDPRTSAPGLRADLLKREAV